MTASLALAWTFDAPTVAHASADEGPAIEADEATLEAALVCTEDADAPDATPVLLVQGTAASHSIDFSWNLQPALVAAGYLTCSVVIPERAFGDLQHNVEFVVHAIRQVHERSGVPSR